MNAASEIIEARSEQPLDVVVGLLPGSKAVYVVAPRKTSMKTWAGAMAKRMKDEGATEWAERDPRGFIHWLMQVKGAVIYKLAADPEGMADQLFIYARGKTVPNNPEISQFLKRNGMGAETPVKMISDVRREGSASQSTVKDVVSVPPVTKDQMAGVGQAEDDEPAQSKMSPDRLKKMLGKSSHSRQDVSALRRGFWNPEKGSLPSDLDPQSADKIVDILLQNQ